MSVSYNVPLSVCPHLVALFDHVCTGMSPRALSLEIYTVSQKRVPPYNHGYNFVNSWSICKILSLLQTAVTFQQNPYWITHHTLSMLLHYLGKLKNQKFALCMYVKHVSSVIFIICPTDICQMSWKLVQRLTLCKILTFYFLFVYCP